MSDEDPRLLSLAGTVADGTPVDWQRAEESATSPDDRDRIAALRLLERVADVHVGSDARSSGSWGAQAPPASSSAPARWGQLEIVERIGHGTFGDVYRAWDPRLARHVALKLLNPRGEQLPSTETLPSEAVVVEGRLMARVRHPGVVTVHGADEIDGRVGVWMELVEGRTLEAEVHERGPLPDDEVKTIARHLADALAAVHRAGLIHRDVKAQNVMREPGGRIVLMDFGAGIDRREDEDVAALAGTPLYLAPEVIAGGAATTESDVYSLGVLLYHLATGSFPVQGRTLGEVRRAHAKGERRRLVAARPDLPRDLARVIDRALAPAAADRFADAVAMAAALADAERRARVRRHWAVAAAAGIGLAMAVAALARFVTGEDAQVPGLSWTEVPQEFRLKANIRGPSLDGQWVPCTSPWGSRNVALCNLVDASVRVLRESPKLPNIGQPAGRSLLSPDGRRLAYAWTGEPDPATTTINVINIDGRANRQLYAGTRNAWLGQWTPDGKALVIGDRQNMDGYRVLLAPVDGSAIRGLRQLRPEDQRAELSPDGTTLLVERRIAPGNSDLIAIDVATGAEALLYGGATDDVSPLWLPDGRGIVFVTNPEGCRQVVRLAIEGGKPMGVPDVLDEVGPQDAFLSGFGAGGTLFVSSQDRFRTASEAEIDLEAATLGAPRQLLPSCTDITMGADWSPDGTRVAYLRAPSSRERADTRVVVATLTGRVDREYDVPGIYVGLSRVRWSPDGASLAVATWQPDTAGLLHVIDLASGGIREVARTSGASNWIRHPRWDSPGALSYRDGAIWRLGLESGVREEVFRATTPEQIDSDAAFDIAPDGTLALGIARPREGCMVRLRYSDGREVDRHEFDVPCLGATWTHDGSRLLVGTSHHLWLFDRDSGAPRQVLADQRGFWDLALGADDRRLLFTLGTGLPTWLLLSHIPGVTAPRAVRVAVPERVHTMKTPVVEVTLTGRVIDADGKPVSRIPVAAWRRIVQDGRVRWDNYQMEASQTDDDGRYVLTGRPPGEYALTAGAYLIRQGVLERRVPPPIDGPDGVKLGYASTVYRAPGSTADVPTLVRAEPGEVAGLDIQFERRPVFDLRGSVAAPPGVTLPPTFAARPVHADPDALPRGGRQIVLRSGQFLVEDMPEGTYDLVVDTGTHRAEARVVIAGRAPDPVILRLGPKPR